MLKVKCGVSGHFDIGLIRRMKQYGARIAIIIHDVKFMMFEANRYLSGKEVEKFNLAEFLIVLSAAMKDFLLTQGVRADMKFVIQEIWDYTTDIQVSRSPQFQKKIHFLGQPSKFVFQNEWAWEIPFQVYASEKYMGENVCEMGYLAFASLLCEFPEGGFGLAWYGDGDWRQTSNRKTCYIWESFETFMKNSLCAKK